MAGPETFEEWRGSWDVFAFAMEVLQAASRARLERHATHIRKLADTSPDNWWKVAFADSRCGSKHLERVRRVAVAEHAGRRLVEFEPTRPWDIVFREATKDHAFWSDNVDRPALQIGRRRVCPPGTHTRGRDGRGRQEDQGGKKRQRKEARQINIFQPFRETSAVSSEGGSVEGWEVLPGCP